MKPPVGPRCRLFNIVPKVGAPFSCRPKCWTPPLSKTLHLTFNYKCMHNSSRSGGAKGSEPSTCTVVNCERGLTPPLDISLIGLPVGLLGLFLSFGVARQTISSIGLLNFLFIFHVCIVRTSFFALSAKQTF